MVDDHPPVRRYTTARRTPKWLTNTTRDFRVFVLRGNMVELAVAVVVGAASAAVVEAIVRDLVTPLIAAVYHREDFADLVFTIGPSRFRIGHLINAVISWLLIAMIVFLCVVKPVNALRARTQAGDADVRPCPECLSSIPVKAIRCSFCTTAVPPASPTVVMDTLPPPPHTDRKR